MKLNFPAALSFALGFVFMAATAHASETRITGAAASELFDSLNIEAVGVHDEHGGPDFAVAKYGAKIGCQKNLGDSQVECWFQQ